MAKVSATAGVPAKAKSSDLDELNMLVGAGKAHEDNVRAQTGGQNSFIKLIGDPQAAELKEGKPEFIKGAKYESFVIANKKVHLGRSFECTVLGLFKLFEETEVKDPKSQEMAKIFGYWMPDDAMNIPLDGTFDRPFMAKDGTQHVLKPVHWVAVYLHGHEDIEDAVFAFRSTGNSVYTQLAKLLKNNSEVAPQLRLKVTNQAIEIKSYNKTYLYPKFDIAGRNFDMVDGKVKLLKDDGMEVDEIKTVLGLYAKLAGEYESNKMVARKSNIQALIGGPQAAAPALGPGKGKGKGYAKADDDDAEAPTF